MILKMVRACVQTLYLSAVLTMRACSKHVILGVFLSFYTNTKDGSEKAQDFSIMVRNLALPESYFLKIHNLDIPEIRSHEILAQNSNLQ